MDIRDRVALCYSVNNLLTPSNKGTVDSGSLMIAAGYSVHSLCAVRTAHSAINRFMTVHSKAEM